MEKPRIYCQSCGRPLRNNDDFGTNFGGTKNSEYCRNCLREGEFTEPDMTIEEMILRVAKRIHEEMGLDPQQAANMAVELIPKLKRWR